MELMKRGFNDYTNANYFIILDCCRSELLGQRGPSDRDSVRLPTSRGLSIAFASAPKRVAYDGEKGRNGLFTGALLACLQENTTCGLNHMTLFGRVREAVATRSKDTQLPILDNQIIGEFIFRPNQVFLSKMLETQEVVDALPVETQQQLKRVFKDKTSWVSGLLGMCYDGFKKFVSILPWSKDDKLSPMGKK